MTILAWPPARGSFRVALLLALLLAGGTNSVQAQWSWRDATGEVTFSDSPPPPNVPRSEILRQPTTVSSSSSDASSPSVGSPSNANTLPAAPTTPRPPAPGATPPQTQAPQPNRPSAPPKTWAEQDADFRKRLADQQKAEEKQAEEEAQTSQRADACNQAKTYLDTLQSGARLMRPDANGERNFLDDDQRAAEIQKAQENVEKNC